MNNVNNKFAELSAAAGKIAEDTLFAELKQLGKCSILIKTSTWGKLMSSRYVMMNINPSSKLDAICTGYVGVLDSIQIFVPAYTTSTPAFEHNMILRNMHVLDQLTAAYHADL